MLLRLYSVFVFTEGWKWPGCAAGEVHGKWQYGVGLFRIPCGCLSCGCSLQCIGLVSS